MLKTVDICGRSFDSKKSRRRNIDFKAILKKISEKVHYVESPCSVREDSLKDTLSFDLLEAAQEAELDLTEEFLDVFRTYLNIGSARVRPLAAWILENDERPLDEIVPYLPPRREIREKRFAAYNNDHENEREQLGGSDSHRNPRKRPKRRSEIRAKFKRHQELLKHNKKKLSAEIFFNFDEIDKKPSLSDIEETFSRLFSQPSKIDNADFKKRRRLSPTYVPISVAELKTSLRKCNSSSPGSDGVTLQDLRKSDPILLTLILNCYLFRKILPEVMKDSRTILLPKKGDLLLATNWRPITIAPILIRIFHGILARRLLVSID